MITKSRDECYSMVVDGRVRSERYELWTVFQNGVRTIVANDTRCLKSTQGELMWGQEEPTLSRRRTKIGYDPFETRNVPTYMKGMWRIFKHFGQKIGRTGVLRELWEPGKFEMKLRTFIQQKRWIILLLDALFGKGTKKDNTIEYIESILFYGTFCSKREKIVVFQSKPYKNKCHHVSVIYT